MSEPNLTPCYVAFCPTCNGLIVVSVADVNSNTIEHAVRDRRDWIRRGERVETKTVQYVRDFPGSLGHLPGCARATRKRKAR